MGGVTGCWMLDTGYWMLDRLDKLDSNFVQKVQKFKGLKRLGKSDFSEMTPERDVAFLPHFFYLCENSKYSDSLR